MIQVAIPTRIAKILTYPDRVTKHNLEILKEAVIRGASEHPGAVYVNQSNTGIKRNLLFVRDRVSLAAGLRIGDVVERHIRDGE